jgi:hypothetical protein
MSESAVLEIQRMRVEFARLVESLSPWLSTEEMCARYSCTPQPVWAGVSPARAPTC